MEKQLKRVEHVKKQRQETKTKHMHVLLILVKFGEAFVSNLGGNMWLKVELNFG